MNLAALHKKPCARKRRWRVTTRENGASPENCGRGDGEVVKGETAKWKEPRDCPRAGPATRETNLPEACDSRTLTRTQRISVNG
ncbi:hypothetical protein E2C01_020368 [Portunus trituberculatus]|uniref:Uncharacterized protein n=1 Tax=Portunus trituberculatus TaxID=210409 RepID=A0A5B7DZP7_PORTR|nr:hypothetical protein [Portunus trituberculatus]